MSELWFNANSAIFQLYHGENNLSVNEDDEVKFTLNRNIQSFDMFTCIFTHVKWISISSRFFHMIFFVVINIGIKFSISIEYWLWN